MKYAGIEAAVKPTNRSPLSHIVPAAMLLLTLACAPSVVLFATPPATEAPTQAPITEIDPTSPPTDSPTDPPTDTPAPYPPDATSEIITPNTIRIFPGPIHYEGDSLSFEVGIRDRALVPDNITPLLMIDGTLIDTFSTKVNHPLLNDFISFPHAWDSDGQAGTHTLRVEIPIRGQEVPLIYEIEFEILADDQRPEQEQLAEWQLLETDCCIFYYLSHTAAARDIEGIAARAEITIASVEAQFPGASVRPFPIVLIDNMWGNGAYATGNEIVISYLDRAYNGLDLDTLIYHEAVHYASFSLKSQTPVFLTEGIAVYLTGGHYKPEPVPERAAALLDLDIYIPLEDLISHFRDRQHEIAYLEAAGFVAYLVESYGWEAFLDFYSSDIPQTFNSDWMKQALFHTYGFTLAEAEAEYIVWLEEQTPGGQSDDLRLTIALFETMRDYQRQGASYQQLPSIRQALSEDITYEFIREPTSPEHIAIEAALTNAQTALAEGDTAQAEDLLEAVQSVLGQEDFSASALLSDYLDIAEVATIQGYEVQRISINPAGESASVLVIKDFPTLETLTFTLGDGGWVLAE